MGIKIQTEVAVVRVTKTYRSLRELTYPLLSGIQPKLDKSEEYKIVAYAKACDNRPVIERTDGQEYLGTTRWIVDEMDLVEID